jgi:hypothetical protein
MKGLERSLVHHNKGELASSKLFIIPIRRIDLKTYAGDIFNKGSSNLAEFAGLLG